MAREAERLLSDSDWLPEPLRTPVIDEPLPLAAGAEALPAFLDGDDAQSGSTEPDADNDQDGDDLAIAA